jgi:hypothetical protein
VAAGYNAFGLSGRGGTLLHNAHSTSAAFIRACHVDSFTSCAATISFRNDIVRYTPSLPPNALPSTHAPAPTSLQVPAL